MMGFIVFLGVIAAGVVGLRYLRKKEMEAFREADMSVFEEFNADQKEKAIDPISVKAQSYLAARPKSAGAKLVALPATESPQSLNPVYELRKELFIGVYRQFYKNLEEVVGGRYRIFVEVPLEEFITTSQEKPGEQILEAKTVSYLLCSKADLIVVCGIQLCGAGQEFDRQFKFLEDLFIQIEKPLFDFPLIENISKEEIREKLDFVDSALARNCPKCGNEMMMRKAVKGKNAGKTFWVCRGFPDCRGITRIGRLP